MNYCPQCGAEYQTEFESCADCHVPLVNKPYQMTTQMKEKYAGLFSRWVASIVDSFILGIPMILFFLFGGAKLLHVSMSHASFDDPAFKAHFLWISLIFSFCQGLLLLGYGTFFLGKFSRTIGHKALGIMVATENDKPLGYGKAFFRTLVFCVYYLPYLGPILMIVSAVLIPNTKKNKCCMT